MAGSGLLTATLLALLDRYKKVLYFSGSQHLERGAGKSNAPARKYWYGRRQIRLVYSFQSRLHTTFAEKLKCRPFTWFSLLGTLHPDSHIMFSKKVHTADIKKSILKFQDSKKDSSARFKHLKIVVEHIDAREGRSLFESNYSCIYYIFYDALIAAENNLKQRVHKAHKEELDGVLFVFEKILIYCPEIIGARWQCHSIARILAKLLHPGNSWKLRKEATRYFILWYQALGENAPIWADAMFATLVPGFNSPIPGQPGLTALANPPSNTVFHDPNQGNLYSSQSSFQHCFMTPTKIVKIEWKDKQYSQYKCFMFLFDKFKQYYQKLIFPQYSNKTDIYVPNIDLPNLRKLSKDESHSPYMSCRVSLMKWLCNFTSL
ncbi:hypothetical protein WDU94_012635 [Cyamophila willieti]